MAFPFSALAPIGGALIDAFSSHSANRSSMRFNERMASTEWQRGTKDMLAAGINPMLAVSQGGNSAPTVRNEPVTKGTATSALSAMMVHAQTKNMALQNDLLREQVEQAKLETDAKKVHQGVGGGKDFRSIEMWDHLETMIQKRISATEQAKLDKTNVEIRELEQKLLQSTMASSISSAKSAAELAAQEVNVAQIRAMLMALDIPEKEAMAKWFEKIGSGGVAAKATMSIGSWLKMIFGSKQ